MTQFPSRFFALFSVEIIFRRPEHEMPISAPDSHPRTAVVHGVCAPSRNGEAVLVRHHVPPALEGRKFHQHSLRGAITYEIMVHGSSVCRHPCRSSSHPAFTKSPSQEPASLGSTLLDRRPDS